MAQCPTIRVPAIQEAFARAAGRPTPYGYWAWADGQPIGEDSSRSSYGQVYPHWVPCDAPPGTGTPPSPGDDSSDAPKTDPVNPNNRGDLDIVPSASNPNNAGTGGGSAGTNGFCGGEERISQNICNSMHPAVTFDGAGNIGLAWHDTRDGNTEIYTRILQSRIDPAIIKLNEGFFFDPVTGRPANVNCSGFSGTSESSGSKANVLVTQGGGRLDVNSNSRVMVLTADRGSVDFKTMRATANSSIIILNGRNTGKTFFISKIISTNVAELNFIEGSLSDDGFVYSVSKADAPLSTDEIRLTCNKSSSQFPDIIADKDGRFHVVFQDNAEGHYEVYYTQIYPKSIGKKSCAGGAAPVNATTFSTVPDGTPNSVTFFQNDPNAVAASPKATYAQTGDSEAFFSYGNKALPDAVSVVDGPLATRTGRHRLFRDFFSGSGEWVGASKATDRATWNQQAATLGISVAPDFLAPSGHPLAAENDFGTRFSFQNIAFIAQTPPDKAVDVSKIALPLKPRCLPTSPANPETPAFADLVAAPKKPVSSSFIDPVDLSGVLSSPLVTIDENPPRFTIEGDPSGTVFTNILTDNGRGDVSRFVFDCSADKRAEDPPRFILGQRRCGTELCAMPPKRTSGTPTNNPSGSYKIKLEVWQGPDYRFVPDQINSAQMQGAVKISDKEFQFDPGEDITNFDYKAGELILPDGHFIFFIPVAGDGVEFFVDAVGSGRAIWSTNNDGTFDQYYVPFTLPPNFGLNAPVYYEGTLANATSGVTTSVNDGTDAGATGSGSSSFECFRIQLTPKAFTSMIGGFIGGGPDFNLDTVNDVITGSNGITGALGSFNAINDGDFSNVADAALRDAGMMRAAFKVYRVDRKNDTLDVIDLTGRMGNFTPPGDSVFTVTFGAPNVFGNNGWFSPSTIITASSVTLTECPAGLESPVPNCIDTTQTNFSIDSVSLFNTAHAQESYASSIIFNVSQGFTLSKPMTLRRAKIFLGVRNFNETTHAGESIVCEIVSANTFGKPLSTTVLSRSRIAASSLPKTSGTGFPETDPIPDNYAVSFDFCVELPIGSYAILIRRETTTPTASGDTLIYDTARWTGTWTGTPLTNGLQGPITTTEGLSYAHENLNNGNLSSWTLLHGNTASAYLGIPLIFEFFDPSGPLPPDAEACTQQKQALHVALQAGEITQAQFNQKFAELEASATCGGSTDSGSDEDEGDGSETAGGGGTGDISHLVATPPLRLTKSKGDSVYPRLGIDSHDNLWLVFHSNRTGADEVYVGRHFCGNWVTSALGGTDFKLSNAGNSGKAAQFPNVVVDDVGNAHVVYQSTDTDDGEPEIFYSRSTTGGNFLRPKRITASPGKAMMPDVAISSRVNLSVEGKCALQPGAAGTGDNGQTVTQSIGGLATRDSGIVTIVWHDNRFGNYEVMAANKISGIWDSSGQGGSDTRITHAPGDSLFPRIASDNKGNLRVVYHDMRRGLENPWIFMSSFLALDSRWDSTGQGGADLAITPAGSAESTHPDVAVDPSNGVFVTWHDTRFTKENPDIKEEVMGAYCPQINAPIGYCGPLCSNIEAFVSTTFNIVSCVKGGKIEITNVPEVCLEISSPGATFFRVSNDGDEYSDWMPFKPTTTLDTTTVPWVLGPGTGKKNVCIQVQDATTIGFPICKEVFLQSTPPSFLIEFYKDIDLSQQLSSYKGKPVAPEGDVYIKLTSSAPLLTPPTFDVVRKGLRLVQNQQTIALSGFSGFSGGIGSFLGDTVTNEQGVTEFSALAGNVFKGRFHVNKDDGFFHLDGAARIIPHGKDVRGQIF